LWIHVNSLIDSGGYTYCALAALNLMQRPTSILDDQLLLHWLVSRATNNLYEHDDEEETEKDTNDVNATEHSNSVKVGGSDIADPDDDCLGFSGRPNKPADTCYSWWIGASLQVRKMPSGNSSKI
jgi:geranylgeranyl transferase type-1 subunit beta